MKAPSLAFLTTFVFLASLVTPVFGQEQEPLPPGYVLIDDMVLPDSVLHSDSAYTGNVWPGGIVPFAYNANVSGTQIAQAQKAMNELANVAFVSFIPRTSQGDYIEFVASTVNQSPIGKIGGRQTVQVTSWNTKYIIVHELMHALGFLHEQMRPDRDNYVTINWGNITSGLENNFQIVNGPTITSGYDFQSIMHYGPTSFSSNGLNTIDCKPAYASFQNQIGNRTYMTTSDALGVQNRYLTPLYPSITGISPTSVSTTSGAFNLDVYGTRFFEGSPNGNGVQGTKVRWNGITLPTIYVDPGHVIAQVPAGYTSHPGLVQISVNNAPPGGGASLGSVSLSVVCNSSYIGLAQNVPATIYNGCQQYVISPAYSAYNVVAVSSPSDWDITMGTGSSAAGGSNCDFVAGSGFFSGNNYITPTTGNVTLYAGNQPATIQHVVSTPMNNGSPTITSMNAGSIVKALHFSAAAVSYRTIQVAGPSNLSWKLLWSGNSFQWRSATANVEAQGQVGGPPVTGIGVVPAAYVLVIYSNGGPIATSANLTVSMGFDFTPVQLYPNGSITTVLQGPYSYQPYNANVSVGHWNAVGVGSTADWDIQMGPGVSQFGGSNLDYVLADGHAGGLYPTLGACAPYVPVGAGGPSGYLQLAPTTSYASPPGLAFISGYMLSVVEFQITTPGNYSFSFVGGSGWSWDLHAPNGSSAWRARGTAFVQGLAVNGTVYNLTGLQPGWYAAVLRHDGGPVGYTVFTFNANYSSIQPPVASALVPASAPMNSGTFNLTVQGSNFDVTSEVRWNGSSLVTSFVSSTELSAVVDSSLLTGAGGASVTVYTPGGGTSLALPFSIGNPVPVISNVTPGYLVSGDPTTTITIDGADFLPSCEARWNGVALPTTFVSPTQILADVDSSLFYFSGFSALTVFNPAPDGGESGPFYVQQFAPIVYSLTPGTMAAMAPTDPPLAVVLTGAAFRPFTTVYAGNIAVPTTYVSDTEVDVTLDPSVLIDATRVGGVTIWAQNTAAAVSNGTQLVVDSGANVGFIRTAPIAPAAGSLFSARVEVGVTLAPFTMIIDTGTPVPVGGFPTSTENLVIGVTELAGSSSWFPLFDGLGLFGVSDGTQLDGNGNFESPQIQMPDPPLGATITVQVIYLDASQPLGINLTWVFDTLSI